MTSNTDPEYYATIWRDGWTHEWNINEQSNEKESRRAIDDYYTREARVFSPDQADPHHHALIMSAHRSASKLISRPGGVSALPPPSLMECCGGGAGSESYFAVSKHHLIALSGMTGLLVSRMLGHGHGHERGARRRHLCRIPIAPFPFGDLHDTTKRTYAILTNRYIHSALAAEYIIGNRYFRSVTVSRDEIVALAASNRYYSGDGDGNVVDINEEQRRRVVRYPEGPVGFLTCDATKNLTAKDITSESLEITKQELLTAYSANIDRLMTAIRQFRRGFVSIDAIRTDPEFVRLNTAFWRYSSQLMKLKTAFEDRDATAASKLPFRAVRPTDYYTFSENKDAKRFVVLSLISEPAVLVPLLYNYDVTCIFDNWRQSYTKYAKTTKTTWARLANGGSTAAFIAFAAVEPGMVTNDYAPTLGGYSAYHTLSMKSCANHIPSRHPVFGALRIKHRHHIKRTAEVSNTMHANISANHRKLNIGIPRTSERLQPTYTAFSEIVDDIRQTESILEFGIELRKVIRPNSGNIVNKKETCDEYTNDRDMDGEW